MEDQFLYLQENGFDPDIAPYQIMISRLPVPEKAKEILTARFQKWKKDFNIG